MFRKQPKIEVNPSTTDRKIIRLGWVLLFLNAIIILFVYTKLPEKLPMHFNYKGEVDRYGAKASIWVLFVIGTLLYYGLNLIIKKVPAYKHNYPVKITDKNAATVYQLSLKMMVWLNMTIVLLFLLISIHIVLISLEIATPSLIHIVIIVTLLTIILPFFFMYKMFKVPK